MKNFIKKFIPSRTMSIYHLTLARLANVFYGRPSDKLNIIGITGTKGKSSAANFIWSVLEAAGHKTGLISTAVIRIDKEDFPNNYHMTMPGRFALQKLLAEMLHASCEFVVIETTSQGILQYRHAGISYDYAIFTNLYPEHLNSHGGSMEEYKKTKGKLFAALRGRGTSIVNADSPYKDFFLSFGADKKITYGIKTPADLQATDIRTTEAGSEFSVDGHRYRINIPGVFNVENSLPAIAVAEELGLSPKIIARGLSDLKVIPGRMERIETGPRQDGVNQNFKVYVDYAHQKESMEQALRAARQIAAESRTRFGANPPHVSEQTNLVLDDGPRVIVLLGAEGGGRDKQKRPAMGRLAGELANYVVVSNVDPYEDDPKEIIEDIAVAAEEAGKRRGENLFTIEDRREGISKALSLAEQNDVVLITGKGSEQSIIIGGQERPWDDRVVVREELEKICPSYPR